MYIIIVMCHTKCRSMMIVLQQLEALTKIIFPFDDSHDRQSTDSFETLCEMSDSNQSFCVDWKHVRHRKSVSIIARLTQGLNEVSVKRWSS